MIIPNISIPNFNPSLLNHCDIRPNHKGSSSIKYIIADNYDYILNLYKNRKLSESTFSQVQMMLLCSTPYLGYVTYECPSCSNFNIVPKTCKSRFCNSCGIKATKLRAAHVSSVSLDVTHRHVVFTIPQQLRKLFYAHRELLNLLFIASRNSIATMTNKNYLDKLKRNPHRNTSSLTKFKSPYLFKDISLPNRFGAISTLHTFGRDLKFSPHIHMLVPEIYYHSKKDKLISLKHFNYHLLRKTWQFQLLSLLKPYLSPKLIHSLYTLYPQGFYVYAKQNRDLDQEDKEEISQNTKMTIQYVLRYTGRPAMAESRLSHYDPQSKTVEWFYTPHENEDETIHVKEHAYSFIHKLLIHIPSANFKMIRYYGFYANAANHLLDHIQALLKKNSYKLTKVMRRKVKKNNESRLKYRTLLIESFHRDPLLCRCGAQMKYIDTYNPFDNEGRRIVNDGRYRSRCINEMLQMRIHRKSTTLGT